ncbi:hypothetical protein NDU88_005942 [Pleurodeles waltl]|uniref:Uncharacterized protein n=1 Tax=Pleurodeles waltl TaxID=8319 RepID=A0AAV7MZ05_PLEWA|nr:hypothetical protein NDU88_005942 [Pleurodeles waltl]
MHGKLHPPAEQKYTALSVSYWDLARSHASAATSCPVRRADGQYRLTANCRQHYKLVMRAGGLSLRCHSQHYGASVYSSLLRGVILVPCRTQPVSVRPQRSSSGQKERTASQGGQPAQTPHLQRQARTLEHVDTAADCSTDPAHRASEAVDDHRHDADSTKKTTRGPLDAANKTEDHPRGPLYQSDATLRLEAAKQHKENNEETAHRSDATLAPGTTSGVFIRGDPPVSIPTGKSGSGSPQRPPYPLQPAADTSSHLCPWGGGQPGSRDARTRHWAPPHPGSQERYSPPRTTTKASEGTRSTSLAEGAAPYLFRAAEEETRGPAHHTEPKRKRTRGRGGPETHTATQRTGSRQRRKLTLLGPRGGETRPGLQAAHIRTRRQGAQSKTKAPPTKRAGQQGARLDTSSPHATGNRKETATQLHRSLRTHRNKRGARKKSTYFRN